MELKPCPFCGGEARLWPLIMPFDADCDAITVQCGKCDVIGAEVLVDQDVHGPLDLRDLEAEAIAAWNTRTEPAEIAKLREHLAEAVEALERLCAPFGHDSHLGATIGPSPDDYDYAIETLAKIKGE